MLKQEHCNLVEELVTEKKKENQVMRTFESKQKQHNQQQQKPVFFIFPRKTVLAFKCAVWGSDTFKDFT
jgi:hypothetical protein